MAKIKSIAAREILDSRGNPTIEATVVLQDGATGISSCPSGSLKGNYEALSLRDNDSLRFKGLGVIHAINNIEKIIKPKLIGMEAQNQTDIDKAMIELDGTENKGRLGANATLAVSMSVAKAEAKSSMLPLFLYLRQFIKKDTIPPKIPIPMFNLINGGVHGGGNIDMQEFLIIPASFKKYSDSLMLGVTIYNTIRDLLLEKGLTNLTGDEGGFAPRLTSNEDGFILLTEAIQMAQLRLGYDIFCGLDACANYFYQNERYVIKDNGMRLSSYELARYYQNLIDKYHLLYIEDPFNEEDWNGWNALSKSAGKDTMISGDDLTATNTSRLQLALNKKAINALVIKPYQIGTVMESLALIEVAREAGLKTIVSHGSGETIDTFIADFAVAASSDYMKLGAPAHGERVAKYNRLLEIEKQLRVI